MADISSDRQVKIEFCNMPQGNKSQLSNSTISDLKIKAVDFVK